MFAVRLLSQAGLALWEWLIETEVPAIVAVFMAAGAGALAWSGAQTGPPERAPAQTVTDTLERTLTETDTVWATRPDVETFFEELPAAEIDTQCTAAPNGLKPRGLTPQRPVQVEGRSVRLTEFRPSLGRWAQTTYVTEPPEWSLGAFGQLTGGERPSAMAGLSLRWRPSARIEVNASAGRRWDYQGAGWAGRIGVRVHLYSIP